MFDFWARNRSKQARGRLAKMAQLHSVPERALRAIVGSYKDYDSQRELWLEGITAPEAEIEYVASQSLLPPRDHAKDAAGWLAAELAQVDKQRVVAAFIESLATGRMDQRSALGSLASHWHKRNRKLIPESVSLKNHGLRFAYLHFLGASMQHTDVAYAAYDLWMFRNRLLPRLDAPSPAGVEKFRALIDAIRHLPATAKLTDLQRCATGIAAGNKYQRVHVMEILGYCDVLGTHDGVPMRERDLHQDDRPLPAHFYAREWRYPACFWSGEVGIDDAGLAYWFAPWL